MDPLHPRSEARTDVSGLGKAQKIRSPPPLLQAGPECCRYLGALLRHSRDQFLFLRQIMNTPDDLRVESCRLRSFRRPANRKNLQVNAAADQFRDFAIAEGLTESGETLK